MAENRKPPSHPVEIETTERWVAGKSEAELLADLKVYLARLRDDPRSIVDRLRVAAIQLRLGRVQEALIHYEGVLRGYVAEGQVMSAIALCQRILALYPDMPRVQRILTALYARAPRGTTGPSAVTPVDPLEERPTSSFVLDGPQGENEEPADLAVRVFAQAQRPRHEPSDTDDLRPTVPYALVMRPATDDEPTRARGDDVAPTHTGGAPTTDSAQATPAPGEEVVLLTKKKKRDPTGPPRR
jgi:hypothetical protein